MCIGRNVDDGFAAAHTALAIDPTIAEAHLPMVRRLQEKQQLDAAAAAMEAAVRLGPDSWEVNKEAGLFYLFRGDVATATRHYEKAAELMETDFHAWGMLSTCYRALGRREEASRGGPNDGVRKRKSGSAGSQQRRGAGHARRRPCT